MTIKKVEADKDALRVGFSHLLQAFFGLLKLKVLTNILGPSGYSIYALLFSSFSTSTALAKGAVNFITVKRFSSLKDNQKKLKNSSFSRLQKISFTYSLVACLLQLPFTYYIFSTQGDIHYFILTSIAFVFFSVNGAFAMSTIQGLREFKNYSLTYFISTSMGSILQIFAVLYFYDQLKIHAALTLSAVGQFLIQYYSLSMLRKSLEISGVRKAKISRRYFIISSINGISKASSAALIVFSQFLIVFMLSLSNQENLAANYFAYNGIVIQASSIILIGVSSAFFPSLVAIYRNSRSTFEFEVKKQSSMIASFLFPLSLFLIAFENEIIKFLINEDFLSNKIIYRALVIASFIASCKQAFDLSLQCHEKNKYFVVATILSSISLVSLTFFGLKFFGIIGFSYALIAHSLVISCLIIFLSSKIFLFENVFRYVLLLTMLAFLLILFTVYKDSLNLLYVSLILSLPFINSLFQLKKILK